MNDVLPSSQPSIPWNIPSSALKEHLAPRLASLRAALNAQAMALLRHQEDGSWVTLLCDPPEVFDNPLPQVSEIRLTAGPSGLNQGEEWIPLPADLGFPAALWVVLPAGHSLTPSERTWLQAAAELLAPTLENLRLRQEIGQLSKGRQDTLRRLVRMQDERCRRIARDLHDEISQALAAIALDVEAAEIALPPLESPAAERLSTVRGRLQDTIREINRIILDLRPTLLEEQGLFAAVSFFAQQRLHPLGVPVIAEGPSQPLRLEGHVEIMLYRIAQEAVNNIARHAQARHAWVRLKRDKEKVILQISDDGKGFDFAGFSEVGAIGGMGLHSIRERAAIIGAELAITTAPNQGTTIRVVYSPAKAER